MFCSYEYIAILLLWKCAYKERQAQSSKTEDTIIDE